MGLLDDAIREHLDLKRRRGADPAEVERAEREALGPVRRNPSPSDMEPVEGQPASGEGFAYDQAEEEGWSRDSLQEPAAGAAEALYEEPPDERIDEEPPAAERGYDEPPVQPPPDFAGASEPAHEPTPPSARPLSDLGGGETQEYKVEEFLTAEDQEKPGQDDDVLEETPEFLQDTPDHDRLWFEQRPPKDFDFDE
jgi:hypothetical protein